jgi:WD40 repeat protein
VILWEVATGRKLQTIQGGHTQIISRVAMSPDGKHVVTGSCDKTAILWEAATGKKLKTFQGHTSDVLDVALSADGKHVRCCQWQPVAAGTISRPVAGAAHRRAWSCFVWPTFSA